MMVVYKEKYVYRGVMETVFRMTVCACENAILRGFVCLDRTTNEEQYVDDFRKRHDGARRVLSWSRTYTTETRDIVRIFFGRSDIHPGLGRYIYIMGTCLEQTQRCTITQPSRYNDSMLMTCSNIDDDTYMMYEDERAALYIVVHESGCRIVYVSNAGDEHVQFDKYNIEESTILEGYTGVRARDIIQSMHVRRLLPSIHLAAIRELDMATSLPMSTSISVGCAVFL